MQIKIGGKVLYTCSWRRVLYTLCFFMFCVIDQRVKTCSGLDGWLETFRDLTGVVMAVVIMSHYKKEDFLRWKLPYLVWTGISVIGAPMAFLWGMDNRPFLNDWAVVILDVVLFGYILIHTVISVAIEKKFPKLNWKFAAVWAVMMVLMIVSRSNYIWPFCYLVMFGCFYLTDLTKEEQEDLFQGILNGIILGFFVAQGLCFVFRPYDRVRYQGIYHNTNLNALFYLEVLAAVFAKILYVTRIQANKWIRLYYWLGAGVVLSFVFLTIGRSAWITAFLLGLLFLWCLKKMQAKKSFIKNGMVLILCMSITFPLCFGAVRYLPPAFHHPIWFWGEWSESRVHSWDKWDSEKYVDLDEFLDAAVGRITDSVENLLEHSPLALRAEAAEGNDDSRKEPVLTYEQGKDSFFVRSTIYQYYFTHLNLWGYPYEEQGFQLKEDYWIGHAHNILLQYGTDFGIIVMIMIAVLWIWACKDMRKGFLGDKDEAWAGYAMFLLIPLLFGLFEYSWGTGSLSILMMFVAWRKAVCDEERKEPVENTI